MALSLSLLASHSDRIFLYIYRVSWFVDKALGFAAHASKASSEEVDKWFDKAVGELGIYDEMFDPR